jgi:hypothetical protein
MWNPNVASFQASMVKFINGNKTLDIDTKFNAGEIKSDFFGAESHAIQSLLEYESVNSVKRVVLLVNVKHDKVSFVGTLVAIDPQTGSVDANFAKDGRVALPTFGDSKEQSFGVHVVFDAKTKQYYVLSQGQRGAFVSIVSNLGVLVHQFALPTSTSGISVARHLSLSDNELQIWGYTLFTDNSADPFFYTHILKDLGVSAATASGSGGAGAAGAAAGSGGSGGGAAIPAVPAAAVSVPAAAVSVPLPLASVPVTTLKEAQVETNRLHAQMVETQHRSLVNAKPETHVLHGVMPAKSIYGAPLTRRDQWPSCCDALAQELTIKTPVPNFDIQNHVPTVYNIHGPNRFYVAPIIAANKWVLVQIASKEPFGVNNFLDPQQAKASLKLVHQETGEVMSIVSDSSLYATCMIPLQEGAFLIAGHLLRSALNKDSAELFWVIVDTVKKTRNMKTVIIPGLLYFQTITGAVYIPKARHLLLCGYAQANKSRFSRKSFMLSTYNLL